MVEHRVFSSVLEFVLLASRKVQYLRDLGALDESESDPRVVVSNYVLGASNCVGTSRFYAQCCVDPCDQLMELRLQMAAAIAQQSCYVCKTAKVYT